jgi:hypothetical protein
MPPRRKARATAGSASASSSMPIDIAPPLMSPPPSQPPLSQAPPSQAPMLSGSQMPHGPVVPIPPETRLIWAVDPRLSEALLNHLINIKAAGQAPDGSFKMSQYNAAAAAISNDARLRNAPLGKAIDGYQCKTRLEALKRTWRHWTDHNKAISGWGTRSDGLPQASEAVMDDYFKAHPNRKPFRNAFPICYNQLMELIDGTTATGSYAIDIDELLINDTASQNLEPADDSEIEGESYPTRSSLESSPESLSSAGHIDNSRNASSENLRKRALSRSIEVQAKRRTRMSGPEKIASAIETSGNQIGASMKALANALLVDPEQERIDAVTDLVEREFLYLNGHVRLVLCLKLDDAIKRSAFLRTTSDTRIELAKGLLEDMWQEEVISEGIEDAENTDSSDI